MRYIYTGLMMREIYIYICVISLLAMSHNHETGIYSVLTYSLRESQIEQVAVSLSLTCSYTYTTALLCALLNSNKSFCCDWKLSRKFIGII